MSTFGLAQMETKRPPAIGRVALVYICAWIGTVEMSAADAPQVGSPVNAASPSDSSLREDQLTYIHRWIAEKVPACPSDVVVLAALGIVQELKRRDPDRLARLPMMDLPARQFDSMLLRCVGAQLTDPSHANLREEVARRRIEAILAQEGAVLVDSPQEALKALVRIKEMSPVHARRLVEGKMEDDDLALILKKARQDPTSAAARQPSAPKVLTAGDIASAFSRHNQTGAALQRLRAYTIEGSIKSADGEDQRILLFRMRPDRFRLVLLSEGTTRYTLAFDGKRYWQQRPGHPPQELIRAAIGPQRLLGEFIDPMFGEGDASFERLEDGVDGEKKNYHVAVRRSDGSRYVGHIDPESFRQIGRENEDRSIVRYSDFRDVAGIWIAFHEEVTEPNGIKRILKLDRITPNPGMIQALFDPPLPSQWDYFSLERVLRPQLTGGAK